MNSCDWFEEGWKANGSCPGPGAQGADSSGVGSFDPG